MRRRVSGLGEAGQVRALALAAVVLVATVASIALRITSPALLQAGATFDDAHFTTLAVRLIDGQWLGPYDFQTLSKAPGYPLFIAATYKAHLPLKLIEHALHLLAAATIGLALAKVSRSRLLGVIAYCAVALDPAYLGHAASVVSRDAFYGTLSLLLVGGTLLFLVSVPSVIRRGPAWAVPLGLVSGGALGLLAGTYYVTRDERSWLAPALLAAVTVGVASWRRDGTLGWVPAGGALVVAMVGAAASCVWSIDQVASRNEAAYGTRVISDLAEGEIARAYAEWQRVDVGEPKPLVPVTAAQRAAVYAVSPAAAELEAHLNGHGRRWIGPDCATASPGGCDYPGGAFVWVLREAAWANGHQPSGVEAQRYFGRMADEIAAACADELPCVDRGIAAMPPLSRVDDPWRVVGSFWTGTRYMLSFDTGEPGGPRLSQGTVDQWELMLRPLRGIDESQAEYDALAERAADSQQVVAALTDLYRWAARIGVVPALLGLALGLATRTRRRQWPTVAVGGVMLLALLSRLVLLAVVDATAFEAVRVSVYILPGVDFLVVLLVVGWWMLATVVSDEVRLRREASSTDEVEPEGNGEPEVGAAGGRGHRLRGDLPLRGRG